MPEKTDRELLQETHDTVLILKEKVEALTKNNDDQEKRLRFLERYGAILIGMGVVLQFVLSRVGLRF